MFEKFKIIQQLKKIRKTSVDEEFLRSLKLKLEKYIQENPVRIETVERLLYKERSGLNLIVAKFKTMPIPIVAALITALFGGGTVFASQASLPGEALYPIKIAAEEARLAIIFNPESKAEYRLKLSAKRLQEIEELFEKKDVDLKGLNIAVSQLEKNFSKAADIIEKEKQKGKNVVALAVNLSKNSDLSKLTLKKIFSNKENVLKTKEEELKNQFKIARKSGDATQTVSIQSQIRELKEKKELIKLKEEEYNKAIEDEEDRIEKEIGAKFKAEKTIKKSEEEKQEIISEAVEEGIEFPANAFIEFDDLFSQAKSAFAAENFIEAQNFARQAEKSLDQIKKIIKELKKEKEKKEEAEEAIKEAEEKKQEVLTKTQKEDIKIPPTLFTKFDQLIVQAKELFVKNNYQGAKQLAEQAGDILKNIDKEIEMFKKGKEQKKEQFQKEKKENKQEKQEKEFKNQNN